MKTLAAKTIAGITDLPTVPDGRSLLAVGCSYTNEYFKSKAHPEMDCSFTKWPTILGSQLGFDNVVNLGRSGNTNDAIFNLPTVVQSTHIISTLLLLSII